MVAVGRDEHNVHYDIDIKVTYFTIKVGRRLV